MIKDSRGVTIMLVLVFMGVFGFLVSTLSSYVFVQAQLSRAKEAREQAFNVAEAGLEYYRWFLAHNPNDVTNGTGGDGPFEYEVPDPEGGVLGTAEITVTGSVACGALQAIDISSEGSADADPNFKRTVTARYARSSVAEYAYIINSNVWAGADRVITGPYHSNGGIRMDGTHNSIVSSSVEDWLCTASFGCSPDATKDGVFGAENSTPALWQFPVPQIDFAGIAVDLAALKEYGQDNGIYFQGAAGRSGRKGYLLDFQSNGTVTVYKVKNTSYAYSIHIDDISGGWYQDYDTITSTSLMGNYVIPEDCPVIFVADKTWIQGTVKGKVTVAAADLLGGSYDADVIINGNIDYTTDDGSDGLTVIAEESVRIPLVIPEDLSIKGIFIAQGGYYGRNLYPCSYAPYDQRGTLTLQGTIVSNERVGTQWGYSMSGCGSTWSGFEERIGTYDRLLATDPPAFTPFVSEDAHFTTWRED